jgi:hypothetical protein
LPKFGRWIRCQSIRSVMGEYSFRAPVFVSDVRREGEGLVSRVRNSVFKGLGLRIQRFGYLR